MALLNPITPTAPNPLERQVTQLKRTPRRMAESLVREWEGNFDMLWSTQGGVTPAERLIGLGTDAAELFSRNEALVTFILGQLGDEDAVTSGRIAAKVAAMPGVTVHEDGTVTIN